jgi:spermidine/putrescine-binding protein
MKRIAWILLILFFVAGAALWAGGTKEGAKPTMSLICFQGYAEDKWVLPFEAQYNCDVKVTYAGTVEEHFTKVKAAPADYNIVSIDSGRVLLYRDAGLIKPIDTSKLKNYNKIGEFFREHPYGKMPDGSKLHVPIVWGTQTITVNTGKVPPAMLAKYLTQTKDGKHQTVSLDILTAPEAKGYTAFFDESAATTGTAWPGGSWPGSATPGPSPPGWIRSSAC